MNYIQLVVGGEITYTEIRGDYKYVSISLGNLALHKQLPKITYCKTTLKPLKFISRNALGIDTSLNIAGYIGKRRTKDFELHLLSDFRLKKVNYFGKDYFVRATSNYLTTDSAGDIYSYTSKPMYLVKDGCWTTYPDTLNKINFIGEQYIKNHVGSIMYIGDS